MTSISSAILAALTLWSALPAAAQLDSSALRAKFGAPVERETFRIAQPAGPGFDLVVDYGLNNHVCKLEVPALMPTSDRISRTDEMNRNMYDFLADLVTPAMRGKELRRGAQIMGTISLTFVEYENVTINELRGASDSKNTITVTFTNRCRTPIAP
jgi:hypothetical protein